MRAGQIVAGMIQNKQAGAPQLYRAPGATPGPGQGQAPRGGQGGQGGLGGQGRDGGRDGGRRRRRKRGRGNGGAGPGGGFQGQPGQAAPGNLPRQGQGPRPGFQRPGQNLANLPGAQPLRPAVTADETVIAPDASAAPDIPKAPAQATFFQLEAEVEAELAAAEGATAVEATQGAQPASADQPATAAAEGQVGAEQPARAALSSAPVAPVQQQPRQPVRPPLPPVRKVVLMNASDPGEIRVAILENGELAEIFMERKSRGQQAGNIYKGRVVNVEPSLQAAFVDLGAERNGFLHASDCIPPDGGYADVLTKLKPGEKRAPQERNDRPNHGRDRHGRPLGDRGPRNNNDERRPSDVTAAASYRAGYSTPAPERSETGTNPGNGAPDSAANVDETISSATTGAQPDAGGASRTENTQSAGGSAQFTTSSDNQESNAGSSAALNDDTSGDAGDGDNDGDDGDDGPESSAGAEQLNAPIQAPRPNQPNQMGQPGQPGQGGPGNPGDPRRRRRRRGGRGRSGRGRVPGPAPMIAPAQSSSSEPAPDAGAVPVAASTHSEPTAPPVQLETASATTAAPMAEIAASLPVETTHAAPEAPAAVPATPDKAESSNGPAVIHHPSPLMAAAETPEPVELTDEAPEGTEIDTENMPPEPESPPDPANSPRWIEIAPEENDPGTVVEVIPETGGPAVPVSSRAAREAAPIPAPGQPAPNMNRSGGGRSGRERHDRRYTIQEMLREGQEVLVQVAKEGIGQKGPALTTYLSMPGRYLVLMPAVQRLGVSKRIENEEQRRALKDALNSLNAPEDMGVIVRTAGTGRSKDELQRDLDYLMRIWENLKKKTKVCKAPNLVYQEGDVVTRVFRDVITDDVAEIVIDDPVVAERAREFLRETSPGAESKVKLHSDAEPLFHKMGVELQLARLFNRKVNLKSGGSIVIEQTEALIAIDVNTGRFREKRSQDESILATNLEAAREIARQLRLRDIGGLVMIDFIDMEIHEHRRRVERELKSHLARDKARINVLAISSLGVVEMTRQRIRHSLRKTLFDRCPHCSGSGHVKSPESLGLEMLREIKGQLRDATVKRVRVLLNSGVAFDILNQFRKDLARLEESRGIAIEVRGDGSVPLSQIQVSTAKEGGDWVLKKISEVDDYVRNT